MNCILSRKSSTCFSMRGTPLSVFNTFDEAKSSANYENSRNSDCDFAPYRCPKCGKYHLKPSRFIIAKLSSCCSCTKHGGLEYKDAYPTKEEALKMADLRFKATGIRLYVYPCPEGNGWHLTSHRY